MAGDAIGAVGRSKRTRTVGAHIRTPLFFRHAHADQAAALMFDGDIACIVFTRDKTRHPFPFQPCVSAHRRNRSVGHGGRAERAALHLRLHQIARGARRVGTGNAAAVDSCPGLRVIAACGDALHQGMPGWMKFDRVDALALNVEIMQYRRVAIGESRVFKVRGRAECRSGAAQIRRGCTGTLTLYRLLQRQVGGEEVVLLQRRRLIEFGMAGVRVFHDPPIFAAIAPGVEPMLNSEVMRASACQLFATPRSFPLLGSLALLLRR